MLKSLKAMNKDTLALRDKQSLSSNKQSLSLRDKEIIIYCDGGSRGNPGPSASAFVILDQDKKILARGGKFLGRATNNEAEYRAVILALSHVLKILLVSGFSIQKILIFLDSELITRQMTGIYKIRNQNLQKLVLEVRELEKQIGASITYRHVPRRENQLADSLVNKILDKKISF